MNNKKRLNYMLAIGKIPKALNFSQQNSRVKKTQLNKRIEKKYQRSLEMIKIDSV